jgi:hypothetical protein
MDLNSFTQGVMLISASNSDQQFREPIVLEPASIATAAAGLAELALRRQILKSRVRVEQHKSSKLCSALPLMKDEQEDYCSDRSKGLDQRNQQPQRRHYSESHRHRIVNEARQQQNC